MGANSTTKFIVQSGGNLAEQYAQTTSVGAADANKIPALNAGGVLDPSITNAKNTSSGVADAGKLPQLDSTGKLDPSFMPTGIGPDIGTFIASEAIAAGALVNKWNNAGVTNIRNADGASGKRAHGFVKAAVAAAGNGTVYNNGVNTAVSGLTPGDQFLSDVTPGAVVSVAPTTSGHIVQRVGFADTATVLDFKEGQAITLA